MLPLTVTRISKGPSEPEESRQRFWHMTIARTTITLPQCSSPSNSAILTLKSLRCDCAPHATLCQSYIGREEACDTTCQSKRSAQVAQPVIKCDRAHQWSGHPLNADVSSRTRTLQCRRTGPWAKHGKGTSQSAEKANHLITRASRTAAAHIEQAEAESRSPTQEATTPDEGSVKV